MPADVIKILSVEEDDDDADLLAFAPRRSRSGAWKNPGTRPKTLIMEILA